MRRIAAWHGELGLEILYQVPVVYAMGRDVLVEIEAGKEALYPLARRRIIERIPETDEAASRRRGARGRPRVRGPKQWFVPEPFERQGVDDTLTVVCPRWRHYGSGKNWSGWQELVDAMSKMGDPAITAAGMRETSYDLSGPVVRTWDFARELDATIEAMLMARLVIATDAGLAHLAMLCGRPLLLVTYKGLVAPGPVIDSGGRVARGSYWLAGYGPDGVNRLEVVNHTRAYVEKIDGWERPEWVAERAMELVEELW